MKGRSPSPLSTLYSQVRGTDPPITQASLEDVRKRREEESRRARARTKILDQVRGAVQTTFKDPMAPKTAKRRARAGSEEGQWRQEKGISEAGNEDREKEDNDRRRILFVLTWMPPRKRSASPRCRPGRCKLPHRCRSAALGGCRHEMSNLSPDSRSRLRTPEDRGRSPTIQERLGPLARI